VREKAEEEYMPAGPPMSPLTSSYFWMWALYDLRIGKSTDTLAYCQIAAKDVIQMNVHQLDALKKMEGSRMGIYEHVGKEGPHIRSKNSSRTTISPATAQLVTSGQKVDCGITGMFFFHLGDDSEIELSRVPARKAKSRKQR
jgi:hypothetical protein